MFSIKRRWHLTTAVPRRYGMESCPPSSPPLLIPVRLVDKKDVAYQVD